MTLYSAPGQPTVHVMTDTSTSMELNVTLDAGDFDTGSVVVDVYRKNGSMEQGVVLFTQLHNTLLYDTLNLVPGTLYTYYAHAKYNNMASVASAEVSECTNPAEPLQVRVHGSGDTNVTISWNAPQGGITGQSNLFSQSLKVKHFTPSLVLFVRRDPLCISCEHKLLFY